MIVGEVVEVIDDGKGVKGEIVGVVGCDTAVARAARLW